METDFTFYKYEIVLSDSSDIPVDLKKIFTIDDTNLEPIKIKDKVIGIKKFEKKEKSNRFHAFSISSGDSLNYCDRVFDIDDEFKEKENPKKENEVELGEKIFYLIDYKDKYIYLSKANKKDIFIKFVEKRTEYKVLIKPILDEGSFLDHLKSISSIYFKYDKKEKGLFDDGLDELLAGDIHNYGADSYSIKFNYNHTTLGDFISNKVRSLISKKDKMKKLKIIGTNKDNLETIFHLNGVNEKIYFKITPDANSKEVNFDSVIDKLITEIE